MQNLTKCPDWIKVINRQHDKISPILTVIVPPEYIDEFQTMCHNHLKSQKCSEALADAIKLIAPNKLAGL